MMESRDSYEKPGTQKNELLKPCTNYASFLIINIYATNWGNWSRRLVVQLRKNKHNIVSVLKPRNLFVKLGSIYVALTSYILFINIYVV